MSTIDEAIRSRMVADVALTALVGQRIYKLRAPQGVTAPFIVMFRVDASPIAGIRLDTAWQRCRLQVSSFAATAQGARDVADAVRAAINRAPGRWPATVAGVQIDDVSFDLERDLLEEDVDLYQVAQDYECIYAE